VALARTYDGVCGRFPVVVRVVKSGGHNFVDRICGVSSMASLTDTRKSRALDGHGTSVHVVRVRKSNDNKHGEERHFQTTYLRRTWRESGTVGNETVATCTPARACDRGCSGWTQGVSSFSPRALTQGEPASPVLAVIPGLWEANPRRRGRGPLTIMDDRCRVDQSGRHPDRGKVDLNNADPHC
jgi:hypothetical protein